MMLLHSARIWMERLNDRQSQRQSMLLALKIPCSLAPSLPIAIRNWSHFSIRVRTCPGPKALKCVQRISAAWPHPAARQTEHNLPNFEDNPLSAEPQGPALSARSG
jgi:hypothetical protein